MSAESSYSSQNLSFQHYEDLLYTTDSASHFRGSRQTETTSFNGRRTAKVLWRFRFVKNSHSATFSVRIGSKFCCSTARPFSMEKTLEKFSSHSSRISRGTSFMFVSRQLSEKLHPKFSSGPEALDFMFGKLARLFSLKVALRFNISTLSIHQ